MPSLEIFPFIQTQHTTAALPAAGSKTRFKLGSETRGRGDQQTGDGEDLVFHLVPENASKTALEKAGWILLPSALRQPAF